MLKGGSNVTVLNFSLSLSVSRVSTKLTNVAPKVDCTHATTSALVKLLYWMKLFGSGCESVQIPSSDTVLLAVSDFLHYQCILYTTLDRLPSVVLHISLMIFQVVVILVILF